MHAPELHLQEGMQPVNALEVAARQIGQEWRIRLAAADDLLALVDKELAAMQQTLDGLR